MKKVAPLVAMLGLLAATSAGAGTIYTKPAVRDAWADTAAVGDITDPGNAFVSAGWLSSSTPPARQYFNWVLNYNGNGVRYLMQNGVSSWDTLETYPIYGLTRDSSGILYESLATSNIGNTPSTATTWWGPILTETATGGDNSNKAATTAFVHTAVSGLAPLASPTFTGTPASPTASTATSSTEIATTAFVHNVAASYAPLASPTFTGVPAAPTATGGTNTTQIATTAFVTGAVTGLAPLASPSFTGTPLSVTPSTGNSSTDIATTAFVANTLASSPALGGSPTTTTQTSSDNSTKIATTAYVKTNLASYAPLASPALTGTPTAPTAATGNSSTQIATTAFVNPGTSIGTNGYSKRPNGLILEWGYGPLTGSSPQSVTFPLACPTAVLSITVTPVISSGAESFSINASPTTTGFTLNSGSGSAFYWQMICH